jgi:hypothetical protein
MIPESKKQLDTSCTTSRLKKQTMRNERKRRLHRETGWGCSSLFNKERSAKTLCSQIHKFDSESGAEICCVLYDCVARRHLIASLKFANYYGKYGKNKKRREFRSAAFVDED